MPEHKQREVIVTLRYKSRGTAPLGDIVNAIAKQLDNLPGIHIGSITDARFETVDKPKVTDLTIKGG